MPTRYGDNRSYDRTYEDLLLADQPAAGLLTGPGGVGRETFYGSPAAERMGLRPYADAVDDWVAEADLKDVINYCNEHKLFPKYHISRTALSDPNNTDQNGLPYCVTEDSEVLTTDGWVSWPEYDGKQSVGTVNQHTHRLEFQRPAMLHAFEYDGDIVYSTNERVNFGVTPNHRMYVRKWDERRRTLSDRYEFVTAGNLGWYAGLLCAPSGHLGTELVEVSIPGDRNYSGDDFLAMLAMIIADGWAGTSENTKYWVSFCCFHDRWYDRVSALAARIGFKENPGRRGVWTRYDAGALAEWVRANCYGDGFGSTKKKIPGIVKWVSERQITHFLAFYGDQRRSKPLTVFDTSSRQIVDDLQELLLRIGKRSTPSWAPPNTATLKSGAEICAKERCRLVVGTTNQLSLDRKKHITTNRYKGMVYCATVPNSTLVTRRNGSVLISGNCWAWGASNAIMCVREIQKLPFVRLAPVTLGWLVNWRAQGYYCDGTVAGAREKGIASVEMVHDEHSRDWRKYHPQWEEDRLNYRLDEVWDIDCRRSDLEILRQKISILRSGSMVYGGLDWWNHALGIAGANWEEGEYLNVTLDYFNSHRDGLITLTGRRMILDVGFGFRSAQLPG